MPAHRLVETGNILPQKAAWAKHRKPTVCQLQPDVLRFGSAHSGGLVNGRGRCWMKSDNPRPLLLTVARTVWQQQVTLDKQSRFTFIPDKLPCRRSARFRPEHLQFHRRSRLRHRAQKPQPRIADDLSLTLPAVARCDRLACLINQQRSELAKMLVRRIRGSCRDVREPAHLGSLSRACDRRQCHQQECRHSQAT